MFALVSSLKKNRRLLRDLVSRDLRARYVGSSMGFFWSVIFPVLNLFVYMFVFRLVLNARWSDQQGTGEVALLMLAGIIVWQAFAESVSRITNTLVENQNLIQKVVFPSEVLPVYLAISSVINMFIGLGITLLGVVYFAYVRPEVPAALPPPPPAVSAEAHADREALAGFFLLVASARSDQEIVPAERAMIERSFATTRLPEGKSLQNLLDESVNVHVAGQSSQITTPEARALLHERLTAMLDADGERTRPEREFLFALDGRRVGLGPSLVCLPLLLLIQVALMLGFGYFLATFNLFLRDTYHLIGVVLTVWMFATPIFYPAMLVESKGFGWMLDFNPMYWLIDSYREILMYAAWPDWRLVGLAALAGAGMLFLGSRFFLAQKPRFPDLL